MDGSRVEKREKRASQTMVQCTNDYSSATSVQGMSNHLGDISFGVEIVW